MYFMTLINVYPGESLGRPDVSQLEKDRRLV